MQRIDVGEFLIRFYPKLTLEEVQFCESIGIDDLLVEAIDAYFNTYSIWIETWEHLSQAFINRRELFWRLIVCFSSHVEARMFFTSRSQCANRFLNLMIQISRGVLSLE